jgi:very-short-patch-repair endonuclease
VPAWVDADLPEQRILEQAMRLTSGGAVTGWAACRMHGAAFFDGLRDGGRTQVPVPLGCGPLHQIRRVPGDDLVRDILTPEEIVDVRGVPCTTVPRATFDAMRYARTTREAVVALDMMAAAGLTTVAQMRDYVGRKQTWTGVQRARDAVALADDLSRSPQESRLRLIWQLDAGRGRPLVNRPVFDRQGRLLGYPDLLDPEAGVVGEYDGADHRSARQHSDDVDRESGFRDHLLEVVRFTGPDMTLPQRVIDRIHAAYARARWVPPARRTWTLRPPAHWPRAWSPDETLAGHGLDTAS